MAQCLTYILIIQYFELWEDITIPSQSRLYIINRTGRFGQNFTSRAYGNIACTFSKNCQPATSSAYCKCARRSKCFNGTQPSCRINVSKSDAATGTRKGQTTIIAIFCTFITIGVTIRYRDVRCGSVHCFCCSVFLTRINPK